MNNSVVAALLLIGCCMFLSGPAGSQEQAVPTGANAGYVIPISGRLDGADGEPVADGMYRIVVSLYESAQGGIPECAGEMNVEVRDGAIVSHAVIDLSRMDNFDPGIVDGRLLYLGIAVQEREGQAHELNAEMVPRIAIYPLLFAQNAARVGNVSWDAINRRLLALERKTHFLNDPNPQPPPAE